MTMTDRRQELQERQERQGEPYFIETTRDDLVHKTLVDVDQWHRTMTVILVSMLVIGFAIGFATGAWILVRR